MMHIEVKVDGFTYIGKSTDEMSAKDAADKTYKAFKVSRSGSVSILMHLVTGSILVLGPDVVSRAHIFYHDD